MEKVNLIRKFWNTAKMTDTIKIWKVNECDWIAAKNEKDALSEYSSITDIHEDDIPIELTEDEMNTLIYTEDEMEESTKTFRSKLNEMIANGEKFPTMFASTEW